MICKRKSRRVFPWIRSFEAGRLRFRIHQDALDFADGAGQDRAKSVASNFNNHFFSSKPLICFGFRCAVNPMTFWLRRSTKDAFRLFVSGGNQVLTGQQRLQGAQKPKPKTYDFSRDTASADAFAAKFENARSGSRSCVVPSQNTPPKTSETIRPNTDVLCFVEKKGKKMCREGYIRDLRTRHQTGYGPHR